MKHHDYETSWNQQVIILAISGFALGFQGEMDVCHAKCLGPELWVPWTARVMARVVPVMLLLTGHPIYSLCIIHSKNSEINSYNSWPWPFYCRIFSLPMRTALSPGICIIHQLTKSGWLFWLPRNKTCVGYPKTVLVQTACLYELRAGAPPSYRLVFKPIKTVL